jgi:purine-binding chemotaxis protein CheW
MVDAQQFCTFFLDGLFFGVEVSSVQEVIRPQKMTRVPLAPAAVAGLINLRGQIVTAIDLRQRLGLRAKPDCLQPMNVVVRSDECAVSLLVDDIGDLVEVSEENYEPPPETLQGEARKLIRGVYKLADRLMHVLALPAALTLATRPTAALPERAAIHPTLEQGGALDACEIKDEPS